LPSQRANGWSAKSDWKLDVEKCSGQGVMARSRSLKPAPGCRLVMDRLWPPENAMVSTQERG
jgi:hypothetical protein